MADLAGDATTKPGEKKGGCSSGSCGAKKDDAAAKEEAAKKAEAAKYAPLAELVGFKLNKGVNAKRKAAKPLE